VGRNDPAGFFYYVMELADDATRGRLIEPATYVPLTLSEMRARRGRIPAEECARFGVEIARVLAGLHRRGLVHRDVKPSNVILVSGVPKLADIGLVTPSVDAHTFVGTEGFVPPDGPGSTSADVFALGKVLYELSTGHDRQEFPKLPGDLARLPDRAALLELNEVLRRACDPAPARRYRDGAALLADLTALNAGVSLRTRRLTVFLLRATAATALIAALGFGAWQWAFRPAPPPPPVAAGVSPRSVAVLPFANATGDPAQEYFSEGISDEILHALQRERELSVTHSRSSIWAKEQKLQAVEIARALRVAFLVEGSLQRVGSRLRIQVRLTRGFDGVSENLGRFEREARDVFALQDDVARAVAQRILQRVTMPPLAPATKNLEAYDAFLRGRALQVRAALPGDAAPKENAPVAAQFERAVALDPNFGVAWARLAEARHRIEGIQTARDPAPESALSTVDRALAVQPDLGLAWSVRGFVVGIGRQEPAAGLRDLSHAEALGGSNAETRMARLLVNWFAGESRGLLPLAREAIAGNPENIERITIIPFALEYLGDFAEADRLLQQRGSVLNRITLRSKWRGAAAALRLAERAPEHVGVIALRVHLLAELGRVAEAALLAERLTPQQVAEMSALQTWEMYAAAGLTTRARALAEAALPAARKKFQDLSGITHTDAERNRKDAARVELIATEIALGLPESAQTRVDEWRRMVDQLPPNRRAGTAGTRLPGFYVQLGQPDVAIALLRRSLADGRNPGYEFRDTPSYAPLRDDPRFLELRRQAESWAAMQPDPPDDPSASPRKQP
jgi:TolB-like protein